ncbi:MAG: hypothetical protein KatS3mg014_2123 [Actinomycetota bacterium]|nr:MAG: hypothetical protein KatS3mg014_2123 [Actinomycetota bacterium]
MSWSRSTPWRRLGLLAGAFLLLGTLLVPSAAPAATPCEDPPAIIAQARLTPGVTGSGLTTLDGTAPVPFDFEVVGTIPDGWMLGLDAIVIRITGPASFLDATGGIFFGMSGSPAYVNGKLAGAVSGVFWGDPTFGVLTPAKPMLQVLQAAQDAPLRLARTIRPTDAVRRAIAAAQGVAASEVQGAFRQLPTPLGVAGLPPAKVAELQDAPRRAGRERLRVPGLGGRRVGKRRHADPVRPGRAPGGRDLLRGRRAVRDGDRHLHLRGLRRGLRAPVLLGRAGRGLPRPVRRERADGAEGRGRAVARVPVRPAHRGPRHRRAGPVRGHRRRRRPGARGHADPQPPHEPGTPAAGTTAPPKRSTPGAGGSSTSSGPTSG